MSCLLSPHPQHSEPIKARKSRIRMKAYIPCSQKPGKPAEGRPESAGSCIYLPPTGTSLLQPSPAPVGEKPQRMGHLVQPLSPGLGGQVVQFSHSVVSNPLRPHRLEHTRPPCPSPTPGAYSNSCPMSWWCHPTISSSVIPFSSRLQSFPASGSFQMSQFFT